jgi:hypothetical protein
VKIAVAILMLWAAFITTGLVKIQDTAYAITARLDVIEHTRFTEADGLVLGSAHEKLIGSALTEIKDCLNKIQQDRLCD